VRVRAGHYPLAELKLDLRGFIERLLGGELQTPDGVLHFPAAEGGHHAASYVPFHPDGLQTQRRINYLTLMGGQTGPLRQPEIDWEIKAATSPYDGIQELANEFGLGVLTEDTINVGLIAYNVAAIDTEKSKVDGTNADVHVLLARGLPTDGVVLGYRSYVPGMNPVRSTLSGQAMQWTEETGRQRGRAAIQVVNAAVLNCTVSYAGVAQAHFWLSDPTRVQNARRAVYETFDPKLQNLQAIISGAQSRGQDARNLEAAVAWLSWMLGFGVAHLGAIAKAQDAPDLVIATSAGNFAVVECTTGLLKAENKLALLHSRAAAVRRSLAASSNTVQRVLPVIVTSKTRSEVAADIEAAEKWGIHVITREGLEEVVALRTMLQPNAEQVYAEAERIVAAALEKHQAQGGLALSDQAMTSEIAGTKGGHE
jgi:hypothetical protein